MLCAFYYTYTFTNTPTFITPSEPTATLRGRNYYFNCYFSLPDQETEIPHVINNMCKATQCVNAGSWFQTQAFTFQVLGTLSDR